MVGIGPDLHENKEGRYWSGFIRGKKAGRHWSGFAHEVDIGSDLQESKKVNIGPDLHSGKKW